MSTTRIVRTVDQQPNPLPRSHTFVLGHQPVETPSSAYARIHRALWSACCEEKRAGLFVFAVHLERGFLGRLWLAATEAPRAGTLGRHELVDLSLTTDGGLSLRHVLFVVRLVEGRVRFTAVDLETTNGLHTSLGPQHVMQAHEPTLLRSSSMSFFCVPTGARVLVPEDPIEAWRRFDVPREPQAARWSWLKKASPLVGVVTLHVPAGVFPLSVDEAMAKRGVLIGREQRCDVIIPDPQVSRVHAAVLSIDGAPHLVDCGSTNGISVPGRNVDARCWPLADADRFLVGRSALEWHAAQ